MDRLPGQGRVRNVTVELRNNARRLRAEMTDGERTLWRAIRERQINGLRFRRQHTVGTFILDFYCPSLRFAIEVDGAVHTVPDVAGHDLLRQQAIEHFGITFLRVPNTEVENNLMMVLEQIRDCTNRLAKEKSSP